MSGEEKKATVKVTVNLPRDVVEDGKAVAYVTDDTLTNVIATGIGYTLAALAPDVAKAVRTVRDAARPARNGGPRDDGSGA